MRRILFWPILFTIPRKYRIKLCRQRRKSKIKRLFLLKNLFRNQITWVPLIQLDFTCNKTKFTVRNWGQFSRGMDNFRRKRKMERESSRMVIKTAKKILLLAPSMVILCMWLSTILSRLIKDNPNHLNLLKILINFITLDLFHLMVRTGRKGWILNHQKSILLTQVCPQRWKILMKTS